MCLDNSSTRPDPGDIFLMTLLLSLNLVLSLLQRHDINSRESFLFGRTEPSTGSSPHPSSSRGPTTYQEGRQPRSRCLCPDINRSVPPPTRPLSTRTDVSFGCSLVGVEVSIFSWFSSRWVMSSVYGPTSYYTCLFCRVDSPLSSLLLLFLG